MYVCMWGAWAALQQELQLSPCWCLLFHVSCLCVLRSGCWPGAWCREAILSWRHRWILLSSPFVFPGAPGMKGNRGVSPLLMPVPFSFPAPHHSWTVLCKAADLLLYFTFTPTCLISACCWVCRPVCVCMCMHACMCWYLFVY